MLNVNANVRTEIKMNLFQLFTLVYLLGVRFDCSAYSVSIPSENCDEKDQRNRSKNVQVYCFNTSNLEIPKGLTLQNVVVRLYNLTNIFKRHFTKFIKLSTQSPNNITSNAIPVDIRLYQNNGMKIRLQRTFPSFCLMTNTCSLKISFDNPDHDACFPELQLILQEPFCKTFQDCALFNEASKSLIQNDFTKCEEYCSILPNTTDIELDDGFLLFPSQQNGFIIQTKIVTGSSYGCKLHLDMWIYPKVSVAITIHASAIHKTIYQNTFTVFERVWKDVSVPIGRIDEAFYIQLNIKSLYKVAMRNVKLLSCDSDNGPQPCLSDQQMQCSTGICIESDQICDLRSNCLNGEDETDKICGNLDTFQRCDFNSNTCGWKSNSEHSVCAWKLRTDLNFPHKAEAPKRDPDGMMMLNSTECDVSEQTFITLALRRTENFTTCRMRLFYMITGKASVYIYQCTIDGDCSKQLAALHEQRHQSLEWKYKSINVPTELKRFHLRIYGEFDNSNSESVIAIDNISFRAQCFSLDTDLLETPEMLKDIQGGMENGEQLSIVVGTILGLMSGCVLLLTTYIMCRYRKASKEHSTFRQLSSNSTITSSTNLLGMRKGCMFEKSYDNDSTKPFLHSTTGVSSLSPLYDWSEPVDDVMHIIPRNKIKIKRMLGKGAFGEVYYGLLADVARLPESLPVAIKMLPSLCSEQSKTEFFVEAVLLSKLRHPNIVKFLGISLDNTSLYLLLELMEGGDLKSFVRECRINNDFPELVGVNDLLKLCIDVAKGCQYLENNKFIHRDIAARNCLLTERGSNRMAKIADFGMTKNVLSTNYYRKNGMAMVPVKWMPPEAFHDGVFTTKTDVWGYGIVLWEVFTFGHVPYPGKSNSEVMEYVAKGGRLEKPATCSYEIYTIMQSCWKDAPGDRPGFTIILEKLMAEKMKCGSTEENMIYTEIENTSEDDNVLKRQHSMV